ncbi:cytochrome b/b6 domain-containing protein [Paracoccus sp. (in: a-proteobacteria)]|uniref:cytochrome b n=1 Tax=Paracoccus sp. TaxID=267 RepID=UPI00321FA66C
MQIWDSHERYGAISRPLHWGMAALMVWQFGGVLAKKALGEENGLAAALSGNHTEVGTMLAVLIVLRLIWAFANRHNRPPHDEGLRGQLAKAGHLALYALMVLVPAAALLRAWGGKWGYSPFGIEVFPGREPEQVVGFATWIGGTFHGELGLIMGALILGHILMAVIHARQSRGRTVGRMAG